MRWFEVGGPKKEAKIDPNRSQNDSKVKTMFKNEKIALQPLLGAILGRSWGTLEVIVGSKKRSDIGKCDIS